jgi:transcriptional regulator with XRE-family HTH domain
MGKLAHWTQRSTADFVYNISSNFVAQLETRMEDMPMSKTELAERIGKTNGRVSQVFNDPGNLSLRVIVEYARALGMKVGIIAYDDGDPGNNNGPINPDVFVASWEKVGRPSDLFEVAEVGIEPVKTISLNAAAALYFDDSNKPIWGHVEDPAMELLDVVKYSVIGQSLVSTTTRAPKPQSWPWKQEFPINQMEIAS